MAEIELTRGYMAIVDDEDIELLSFYHWFANPDSRCKDYLRIRGQLKANYIPNRVLPVRVGMSRLLMLCPDDMYIDHINGNSLDNRRQNLRVVTRSQNMQNRRLFKNNTSGYKGVRKLANGKYRMSFSQDFDDAEEAARLYDRLAKLVYGEYARPNFPD